MVLIAETFVKMVERAVNEYHLCDMKEAFTTVLEDELSIPRLPLRTMRQLKIGSDFVSHKELCRSRRRDCSSSYSSRGETRASKGRYSCNNVSDESFGRGSNHSRHPINTQRHKCHHSSKQFVTVFKPVQAYYQTSLTHCSHCLSDRSVHHDDNVSS